MNLSSPLLAPTKLLHSIGLKSRRLLPRQQSRTFGPSTESEPHRIGRIYVINLDRQPDRWAEVSRELNQVLDWSRAALTKRAVRYPAVDARSFAQPPLEGEDVDPFYTLGDQLFANCVNFLRPRLTSVSERGDSRLATKVITAGRSAARLRTAEGRLEQCVALRREGFVLAGWSSRP